MLVSPFYLPRTLVGDHRAHAPPLDSSYLSIVVAVARQVAQTSTEHRSISPRFEQSFRWRLRRGASAAECCLRLHVECERTGAFLGELQLQLRCAPRSRPAARSLAPLGVEVACMHDVSGQWAHVVSFTSCVTRCVV
eukprot:COSAG01_NODE_18844_length_1049_cov_1.684211_1_plen_137_part_00